MLWQYIKYRFKAKGIRQIHSPFLYDFYNQILRFNGNDTTKAIESAVGELKRSGEVIDVIDFGTGKSKSMDRKVSEIAKRSATGKGWGRFLYALASYVDGTIVELGTNLGIGTAYLTSGNLSNKVYSIEGCPNLSSMADKFLKRLGLNNYELLVSRIQDIDLTNIPELSDVGLVYIDADHTFGATLEFYRKSLMITNSKSIVVIDDIHWSSEMTKAWNEIILDSRITLSIDMFFKGIIFFDPALSKQNLILK